MKRRALVTGCGGQTGSYLVELLLEKGYEVFGLVRRTSVNNLSRLTHVLERIRTVQGDLTDATSLREAVMVARPHEVYNLAAQSHVGESFISPISTMDITGMGAVRLFDAVKALTSVSEHVRIYQASSSEMFGNADEPMQTEETPLRPVSPYGCAKTLAHHMASSYRQAYGLYISCGIAFNHESPRRGKTFVTRKITQAIAAIKYHKLQCLRLGDTSAKRDWSHAKDIAYAAWLSLQPDVPGDYVFASGQTYSVQEFADLAFNIAGLNAAEYIKTEPGLLRPVEVHSLCGLASKARRVLGWESTYTFQELVAEMVNADLAEARSHHSLPAA